VLAGAGLAALTYFTALRPAFAAPEPGAVIRTWQVEIKPGAPERMIVASKGAVAKQTYWYVRYTVTNNSGQDVVFTPQFELLTDTGQIIQGGKAVDYSVFEAIKTLYKSQFLEDPFQIFGKLLQGEDNAKDGVAIFTGVDAEARKFRIAVSGLSGETAEVESPVTHQKVVLHKTLILEYDVPGEAIGIAPQPQFKGKKWVMK